MTTHFLVADDDLGIFNVLRRILERHYNATVVHAADGRSAAELARHQNFEIVFMDVGLHELAGPLATAQICSSCSGTRVLGISGRCDDMHVARMLQAGTSGYIVKPFSADEVVAAIESALAGKHFFSKSLKSLDYYLSWRDPCPLRSRQREVLQLLSEGNTHEEISNKLGLSRRGVDYHLVGIRSGLGIHEPTLLTRYAIDYGLTFLDADRTV